jgi:4-amino-4-deoxy-L-arabinose transferase-like glycosyltransferase
VGLAGPRRAARFESDTAREIRRLLAMIRLPWRRFGDIVRPLASRRPLAALTPLWLGGVLHVYLPSVTERPLRLLDFHLRRSGTYDLLLLLWITAVAYCTGRRLLARRRAQPAPGAEEIVFSTAAGLILLSWTTLLVALLAALHRPVAYLVLLIPSLAFHDEMAQLPGRLRRRAAAGLRGMSRSSACLVQALVLAAIVAVLALVLLSALGPSFHYDDLTYHLTGPKNFIAHHRLAVLPDVPNTQFPKNIEMLFTLGMLLHNDVTAKLLHFLLGVLGLAAVYAFGRRFLSRAAGLVAAAILVSTPLFVWEMQTAHNDVGLALYVFLGAYAACLSLGEDETSWLRVAALVMAFAVGIKYWAFPALGAVGLLLCLVRARRGGARAAFRAASHLALGSAAGLLPWAALSFHQTGNPLFPLLNDLFRSPSWTRDHTQMALDEMRQGGAWAGITHWWDAFTVWWKLVADQTGAFGGNIGPFYLMLLPLLVFVHRLGLELRFVLLASLVYYLAWVASGPWTRFLLPALPGFAVACAAGVLGWLRGLADLGRRYAFAGALALLALAALVSPLFEAHGSWARYGSPLVEGLPLRYLAGRESKDQFLARWYPGYAAVQYLNGVPGPRRVFYVHTLPDGFYLDGTAGYHYSPFGPRLFEMSAPEAHRTLRENGFTHLVTEQLNQHTSFLSARESEFTQRYLRKVFAKNAIIVHEILPEAVDQDSVAVDFLDHLDSARVWSSERAATGNGVPRGAELRGPRVTRDVRSIEGERRYVMALPANASVQFELTVPERPLLGFAVGKSNPGCADRASFQVWVGTSEGAERMVYRHDVSRERDPAWLDGSVDLAELASRRATVTFRIEESAAAACSDYYWADPALIRRVPAVLREAGPGDGSASEPTVSSVLIRPTRIRSGSFTLTVCGTGFTPQTYFDVRFRAPGASLHEIANNYQQGPAARHVAGTQLRAGTWSITGVRAHVNPSDHTGAFTPVEATLEVAR